MLFFPAIDLLDGKVVRLERGKRSQCTVYSSDPGAVAQNFYDQGAQWVHIVDLSAAFEEDESARKHNEEAIQEICSLPELCVDIGGGVRDLSHIEYLLNLGAKRIALGTSLIEDKSFAHEAAARFGDVLVADVAAQDGAVHVNGWREDTHILVDDLISELSSFGFSHVVYTDIAKDGMQTGIDGSIYEHIAGIAGFPIVASGGIGHLRDIELIASLGDDVIEGIICGRALFEGNVNVGAALEVLACSPSG